MATTYQRVILSVTSFITTFLVLSCCSGGKQSARITSVQPLDSIEIKYAPSIEIGTNAPDFTARDTSGTEIKLSEFKGSYVVLDFWATWCGDCREENPVLSEIYAEYKNRKVNGKSVVFISYSFDHQEDVWKSYVSQNDMDWIQVSTLTKWHDNPVSESYRVKWIPSFYVIDPDGIIIGSAVKAFRIREILQSL